METQAEVIIKKRGYQAEIIALLVYACALAVIMYFHEPWFDEAQSWLIARDATLKELLGSITHYEGHPPIWILILMPFAKLGVPFEIGIKSINFAFAVPAMGLFIFRSPFKRIIRCTIPFTYFFFYQFGVISRPYSLMLLGFVLCAMAFKKRNEKPFHFVGAMLIICGASAYGIVIAAGISAVWLLEILRELPQKSILALISNRKLQALAVLLAVNILFLLCIYPYSNTYAINRIIYDPFPVRLLYMLFIAPADVLFSNCFNYANLDICFNLECICGFILGCAINAAVFIMAKAYKKTTLFVVPYVFFAIFSALLYFSPHHIGIIAMFYMFLFWCCLADECESVESLGRILRLVRNQKNKKQIRLFCIALVSISIIVPLYWSVSASVNDIIKNYGTGYEAAEFLKENGFDKLNIMAAWYKNKNDKTGEQTINYNTFQGIPALAYFDDNIFINFNGGANNKCYLTHIIDSNGYFTRSLAAKGYPDVLFGDVDLEDVFGPDADLLRTYALVCSVHGNMIWKDYTYENRQFIFLRRDLLDDYPKLKELRLSEAEKYVLGLLNR